jgi:chemotaxis protein CheX
MRLAANLNMSAAAPLYAELAQARGAPIKLDASDVESLGGLCLQVLIAAAAAWRRDGKDFSVANRSAAFLEAMHLLGAQHLLTEWETA